MPLKMMMFALVAFLTSAEVYAQDTPLTINLSEIPAGKGSVYISIYRPEDKWLKKRKYKEIVIEGSAISDARTTSATIEVPQGTYALSIYYDKNGNGKLDTKIFGIPKEPTGLSNNQRPSFGPPKFKKSAFEVGAEPVIQDIIIRK